MLEVRGDDKKNQYCQCTSQNNYITNKQIVWREMILKTGRCLRRVQMCHVNMGTFELK